MRKNQFAGPFLTGVLLLLVSFITSAVEQKTATPEAKSVQPAAVALAGLIADLQSFQADFEQHVQNEQGTEIDFSEGNFAILRPNLFRWEIKKNFAQVIVADGTDLWTYDHDLEQVTIQNQSNQLDQSPLLMLTSSAEELSAAFNLSELPLPDEPKSRLFLLKPSGKEGMFDSVHILFENGVLSELLMADTLGQRTTVTFSNAVLNGKLDRKLFTFEVPDGVDVVDSREKAQPKN